jgi:uncharacterized membrane protein required for colicin V production
LHLYDLIILACIGLGAWSGFRTGAIAQLLRFGGTIVSYWIALQYHQMAVPIIDKIIQNTSLAKTQSPLMTNMISQGLSFVATFVLASLLFSIVGMFLQGIFLLPGLSLINRLVGLFVGAGLAIVIITIIIEVSIFAHIPVIERVAANSTIAQTFDQTFRSLFHTINPHSSDPFHITNMRET